MSKTRKAQPEADTGVRRADNSEATPRPTDASRLSSFEREFQTSPHLVKPVWTKSDRQ